MRRVLAATMLLDLCKDAEDWYTKLSDKECTERTLLAFELCDLAGIAKGELNDVLALAGTSYQGDADSMAFEFRRYLASIIEGIHSDEQQRECGNADPASLASDQGQQPHGNQPGGFSRAG